MRKFSAYVSCAHRLQVADHLRQIQRRMRIDQQMHVIGFAAELDEAAALLFERLTKDHLEPLKHFCMNDFAAILRREDHVVEKPKSAVAARI